MSTTFLEIEGQYEIPIPGTFESNYDESELTLTEFWGGKSRGSCVQFTVNNNSGCVYSQFTLEQVEEIRNNFTNWLIEHQSGGA